MPENLAKECFQRTMCYNETIMKPCTKIVGYKNSYAESLSKRGGIPEEDLILIDDYGMASIEKEIKKMVQKAVEDLTKQGAYCRTYMDGYKDDEPNECDAADQVGDRSDDDESADPDIADDDDDPTDEDPCADPNNAGKRMELDCCTLYKFIDPELIGTDGDPKREIPCDPKNCQLCQGCSRTCIPLSEADTTAIARECQGKKPGEIVVIPMLPSTQEKQVTSCPRQRIPRRRRLRLGTRG